MVVSSKSNEPTGAARMTVASSKCDWSISTPAISYGSRPSVGRTTLKGNLVAGALTAASSKCDWSIQTADISAVSKALRRKLDMQYAGGGFAVSSAKCDWTIRASRDGAQFAVSASVVSAKCDFKFQFGVDFGGKTILKVRGAGSDKCDFRFENMQKLINPEKPAVIAKSSKPTTKKR
jgi:hypothetical protein